MRTAIYIIYENQADYSNGLQSQVISDLWTEYDNQSGSFTGSDTDVRYSWYYNTDGTLNGDYKNIFKNKQTPFYALFKGPEHPDYNGNGNDIELIMTLNKNTTKDNLINVIDRANQIEKFDEGKVKELGELGGFGFGFGDYGLKFKIPSLFWLVLISLAIGRFSKR